MRAPIPWRWVALVAAFKVLIPLPFLDRYGWHGDELYFVAASRHLDLGYVDFPPVVPLLAAADQAMAPGSLFALRLLPVLTGGVIVVFAGLLARELGAGSRAQAWAALAVLLSPVFIGSNALFHTATFDQLAWLGALLLFARLLRTGDQRLWLAVGAAIGVGLEVKHTMLALPATMFLGLLVSDRRSMLTSRWPWLGATIALALFLPNLWWQATHDWISLQYILSHRGHTDGPFAYWWQQVLVFFNPVFVVPGVLGMVAMHRVRPLRPIVYTTVGVLLTFFVMGGKSYYAAPVYPVIYGAAAIWLDGALTSRLRLASFMAPATAAGLFLALAVLPVAPTPSGLFTDEVGWPELADQTAQAYAGLPPADRADAMVVAHFYSEAAAIDYYGRPRGLLNTVSPHLSYWYWAPERMDPKTVVMIDYTLAQANRLFSDCRQVGTFTNSGPVHSNFYGAPILVCTGPRQPLWRAWPSLQALD